MLLPSHQTRWRPADVDLHAASGAREARPRRTASRQGDSSRDTPVCTAATAPLPRRRISASFHAFDAETFIMNKIHEVESI